MFARQLNQIRIDLSITPRGPMLIRSGMQSADPSRPDLECVRTSIDGRPTVYVPGSSLKGVMRSHAERLLLTEGVAITPTFDRDAQHAFNQRTPGDEAYKGTCPLGRTFGTLHVKGRLGVSDLLPGASEDDNAKREALVAAANATERRNGVAIDRLLGSAKGGALFDQEVVVGGRFDGQILMRNVQLYQLTLALLVLRDLEEGFVRLGSSTTRGLGWVSAQIRKLTIETRAGKTSAGQLAGVGDLGENLAAYELFTGDHVDLPEGSKPERKLIWDRLEIASKTVDALAEKLVEGPWLRFLEQTKERTWRA